ncbi:MAG: isocitrate lyase/PEP mutase family protein [Rhodospirillales bacterium]|jgi:2-methylisocitrate lyase-like PEP mutase family enzyme|nr:isocitrate lyase/PEP mutase family protein [Rhodospirillales bacterium]
MAAIDGEARAKRVKFREILKRDTLTVMPGGFSPLYARMAEEIGFECFFLAGSQMSAFLLGVPDNGILGLRDMVDHARQAAARTSIAIQLDADTGFGNAVNVHFAVQEVVRSGVASMNLEDQEAPKKSATTAGRRCIPMAEAVGKIKAAVAARDEVDPEFVICARNDTLGAEGSDFSEALERCIAYVEEGGADFIWLNSVETREDLARACAEIPAPVLTIWGGKDHAPSPEEYEQMGVRIALYPVCAATSGMQAAWHVLNDLHARGPVALEEFAAQMAAGPYSLVDQKMLTRADKVRQVEDDYLPESMQRDYGSTWGHKGQGGG